MPSRASCTEGGLVNLLNARSVLSCCGMFSTCAKRRAKVIEAVWTAAI